METFFIALAREMKLPGFGDNAITGTDGATYPLTTPAD